MPEPAWVHENTFMPRLGSLGRSLHARTHAHTHSVLTTHLRDCQAVLSFGIHFLSNEKLALARPFTPREAWLPDPLIWGQDVSAAFCQLFCLILTRSFIKALTVLTLIKGKLADCVLAVPQPLPSHPPHPWEAWRVWGETNEVARAQCSAQGLTLVKGSPRIIVGVVLASASPVL